MTFHLLTGWQLIVWCLIALASIAALWLTRAKP